MSLTRVALWKCDKCGWEVREMAEPNPANDLMPDGWIHTMMGDDLCQGCVK